MTAGRSYSKKPVPVKRTVSIERLLEWAFRQEAVQLDLPSEVDISLRTSGYGLEWVLIQRARLGATIEGGGHSEPHEDAEVVAGAVQSLDSRGMMACIAGYARVGARPETMADEVQRWEPRQWTLNQNGRRGKTEVFDVISITTRKGRRRREILFTPIHLVPSPEQFEAARKHYLEWWAAIHEVAHRLRISRLLREWEVTSDMPPVDPWKSGIACKPKRTNKKTLVKFRLS